MSNGFVVYPRRDGVPYPQVYSRFKSKDDEDEFYIQDLTENYFDFAVDFIFRTYTYNATFHRAAGTINSETGIQSIRKNYRTKLEQKLSLICIHSKTNKVAGLNILYLGSKNDKPNPTSDDDQSFQNFNALLQYFQNTFNVYENYGVDRVMFTTALCVDEKFRGKGIATEILKARAGVLKAIGLEVTTTIFSSIGAQKAAKAAGYDENYSITYEELEKLTNVPSLSFSHAYGTSCKVLSLKVK